MSWYYARGQEQVGPIEDAEFRRLVASGEIVGQTLVWQQGMADWLPHEQVASGPVAAPQIASPPQIDALPRTSASTFRCTVCGNEFPAEDVVEYQGNHVCAQCKTAYFQRIREGVSITLEYGGFWIRWIAIVLDALILLIISAALAGAIMVPLLPLIELDEPETGFELFGNLTNIVYYLIAIFFETWFIGKYGATPGKMACGLKVVKSDGMRISYARALGRHFAKKISGIICFIGYIMAAFDDQKRGLHDYICDTRVVRK